MAEGAGGEAVVDFGDGGGGFPAGGGVAIDGFQGLELHGRLERGGYDFGQVGLLALLLFAFEPGVLVFPAQAVEFALGGLVVEAAQGGEFADELAHELPALEGIGGLGELDVGQGDHFDGEPVGEVVAEQADLSRLSFMGKAWRGRGGGAFPRGAI